MVSSTYSEAVSSPDGTVTESNNKCYSWTNSYPITVREGKIIEDDCFQQLKNDLEQSGYRLIQNPVR